MTTRSARPSELMTAADPINHHTFDDSWSSPTAQAALDRILKEDRHQTTSRQATRWLRPRYAWSVVFAAATCATVLTLGLESTDTSTSGPAQTVSPAAWTVAKIADNTVEVKGSDYTHPAVLERKLRAAGLAADVKTFTWNPACGTEPGGGEPVGVIGGLAHGAVIFGPDPRGPYEPLTITIHTDKIPPSYAIHVRFPTNRHFTQMILWVVPASWPVDPCPRSVLPPQSPAHHPATN